MHSEIYVLDNLPLILYLSSHAGVVIIKKKLCYSVIKSLVYFTVPFCAWSVVSRLRCKDIVKGWVFFLNKLIESCLCTYSEMKI